MEFAPIELEIDDDLKTWRVNVPGMGNGSAELLAGPTTTPGERLAVENAPGAEVGPRPGPRHLRDLRLQGETVRLRDRALRPLEQTHPVRVVERGHVLAIHLPLHLVRPHVVGPHARAVAGLHATTF